MRLRFPRPGGLLLALLAFTPALWASEETNEFDIEGKLTFTQNDDFAILQEEEHCVPASGWSYDPANPIVDEEKISRALVYARLYNWGASGGPDDPAPGCWAPPFEVPYVIPVAAPDCCVVPSPECPVPCTDPDCKICDDKTYFTFADLSLDSTPSCQQHVPGHDSYSAKEEETSPLNDPTYRRDPGDPDGCSKPDVSCLKHQDMDEC